MVNLEKGQKVDLEKVCKGLDEVIIGLAWDANKFDGAEFDLDAQAFLLGADGMVSKPSNFIFYNNEKNENGSVVHTGDERTGNAEGDDEQLIVKLSQVPSDVERIVFTATIHDAETKKQNFGQVNNAFIRLVDSKTNEEHIHFDLGEDYSIETAVVFAELYRHNGTWKFNAIGAGYSGGLSALVKAYGLA